MPPALAKDITDSFHIHSVAHTNLTGCLSPVLVYGLACDQFFNATSILVVIMLFLMRYLQCASIV